MGLYFLGWGRFGQWVLCRLYMCHCLLFLEGPWINGCRKVQTFQCMCLNECLLSFMCIFLKRYKVFYLELYISSQYLFCLQLKFFCLLMYVLCMFICNWVLCLKEKLSIITIYVLYEILILTIVHSRSGCLIFRFVLFGDR